MAVIVLLLWAVTAGAGLRLLFTSGLGGRRPAPATPAPATQAQAIPAPESAMASATAPASGNAYVPGATKPMSGRAARQAYSDPPTLRRNKNEPIPGLGPLLEFTHPMFAIVGLAFWLGYTLVHARPLAWIAFGLAVATICAGITWFTGNARAAKRRHDDNASADAPAPSFSARLLAIHGAAAALTFALAALTALTARG